jgi:amidohydrolase
MAAEDFSFYLQMVPGCFFFVGSAPDTGKAYPHHKPTFDIDERAMDVGASILLSVVEELLIK